MNKTPEEAVREAIDLTVKAERERCARIAESPGCLCKAEDQHDGCCGACGERIAAEIRKEPSKT